MSRTARLLQFQAQMGVLAQRFGITHVVLFVQDPQTKDSICAASPGSLDEFRALATEKFELSPQGDPDDAEIGWGNSTLG